MDVSGQNFGDRLDGLVERNALSALVMAGKQIHNLSLTMALQKDLN